MRTEGALQSYVLLRLESLSEDLHTGQKAGQAFGQRIWIRLDRPGRSRALDEGDDQVRVQKVGTDED